MPLPKEKQWFTYADYCKWDDSERWELIDGEAYAMAPAPGSNHQGISFHIARQLGNFLAGKQCKVFTAPFDVRLNADTDDDTVVQPDIVVICDKSKININGCVGAPDMVIEILSRSSVKHDKVLKFYTYQRAGVREYWIVDPDSKTVSAYILDDGKYIANAYGETDEAPVRVLEGCTINLPDVFADIIE
jgi:Uma2 family endonuclease